MTGLNSWNASGPPRQGAPPSTPSLSARHSRPPQPFTPITLRLSSVATVNSLACRGLDKLEEKLPFLQQPSDMVLELTRPQGPLQGEEGEGRTLGEQMCRMYM